ncbi:carbon-nitrogen hydrolase family protein [Methanolobus sp. ZRKC5]|uniref:carbon-nitrogen hydrolase family protein n=1 Tax=unclassified Methanolobus TaxID=2629569 RepID=UPI00313C2E78
MKITVCELKNEMDIFEDEWQKLVDHVKSEESELVVLPEMPFYRWVAQTNQIDAKVWRESVEIHDLWMSRLIELAPAIVVGSRPVISKRKHLNEAFVWDEVAGYKAVHHKYYLPDEEWCWEASWYERGEKDFTIIQSERARIGFLICTELWFNFHAREYAKQNIELLVCPRATDISSVDKWIAGGRTAAVVSGAYCLSSNFSYGDGDSFKWGGNGWIIEPENGTVLGTNSHKHPFLTLELDLSATYAAKLTYPRNVID